MEPPSPAPLPPQRLSDTGLGLRHWPGWLLRVGPAAGLEAADLERHLRQDLPWSQPRLRLQGREHAVPRLCCWLADTGCSYRYSGLVHPIEPWTTPLLRLRELLEHQLDCRFNSVLANRYRDGDDAMGWHADDEPELARDAPIASLSLGASRTLRFRPRPGSIAAGRPPLALELADGDLLVMDPPTQRHWQHSLPRRRRIGAERLNLTFRRVRPSG
jgi:alkylated DNA repair dioxygenase AlkB